MRPISLYNEKTGELHSLKTDNDAAVDKLKDELGDTLKAHTLTAINNLKDHSDRELKVHVDAGSKELQSKKELIDKSLENVQAKLQEMQQKLLVLFFTVNAPARWESLVLSLSMVQKL